MEVKQNVNIHNRFDIEVMNIKTNEIKKYTAYNIILDQMWTRLCGGSVYFVNIHFGTGTGTPSPERTTLFTFLGTKAAVDEELIKAIPLSSWKRKIVLNPEEYVDSIITEVGIAFSGATPALVTHAMLKDSEGNPISILKTDTDVVTIYATVFVTLNESPYENLIYSGLPNNNLLINHLIGGSAFPSTTLSLMEILNPYANPGNASSVWVSDVTNKKRKTNVVRFGVTNGNGNVKVIGSPNLFALELPQDGVFTGQPYSGVPIGIGDGVQKKWTLPSMNIRQSSLIIKVNDDINENIIKIYKYTYPVRIATSLPVPAGNGDEVALTPDGLIMAVAHSTSPFITTYDWSDGVWVKRPNPASLPTYTGNGVALTPDGLIMAVAHATSPFVTTYDWLDGAWVKRPNPASLPAGTSNYGIEVALTPDGLIMAVAHNSSPFITTYDWSDGAWVKRPNPASLPTSTGNGVALTPDGLIMAVAHVGSPYITTYDWSDGALVKRPDPASLPAGTGSEVALTPDGLIMAVAHSASPFITTYDWSDGAWVKRPNPASLPTSTGTGVALTPDGLIMAVSHVGSPYITTYEHLPSTTIIFDTPPAVGDVVTADYIVDGIHKTDQYVIDMSCAIQFGEGV